MGIKPGFLDEKFALSAITGYINIIIQNTDITAVRLISMRMNEDLGWSAKFSTGGELCLLEITINHTGGLEWYERSKPC